MKRYLRVLKSLPFMILAGIFIQIFFSGILEVILNLRQGAAEEYEDIISPLLSMTPFMIAKVCVLAPVFEEVMFRGLIFFFFRWILERLISLIRRSGEGHVRKDMAVVYAVSNIAQALVFGIYHGNIYQGVYAFMIGLIFGSFFIAYGSLIPGITAHAAVNISGLYMELVLPEDIDGVLKFVLILVSLLGLILILSKVLRSGNAKGQEG